MEPVDKSEVGPLLAAPNLSATSTAWAPVDNSLDAHQNADHGRCVLTYGGSPSSVRQSCIELAGTAVHSLDLTGHRGVHPHFGVLDVLPLIPYQTVEKSARDVADALELFITEELGVPVYRYGRAHSEERTLPELRRLLRADHLAHPTAGVVCLGIRDPLIAFNVNIRDGIAVARDVARTTRSEYVRALGFELASRGLSQVSMNLIAPDRVGPREAFERVARHDVEIVDCEVVGLVPEPNLAELEGLPLIRPARSIEQALADKGIA